MQLDIFSVLYEKYVIKKPIRLIELFAGYGSQHFALKYLGANVESWRIVEWAVPSIQAYKDAHFPTDTFDYSNTKSFEEIANILLEKGISSNYNEPMTKEQIQRKGEKWCRQVFNNICATKNLVNIQNVKGEHLEIVDTDKYDYIMTYSFPCQDLSLAGLRKGMGKESGTRSGMLWEVERILDEIANVNGELPQILLMENVPQVIGTNNVEHFNEWQQKLQSLGYKSYHQNLIATDYGIPQTRNRTFMISILGDYNYDFPQPIPLKLKLKDMLEDNVDEKYYLSDKMIKCFTRNEKGKFPRGERFKEALKLTNEKNIAATITTCAGNRATDNFILTKDTENYIEWQEKGKLDIDCRAFKEEKVMSTIMATPKNKVLLKIPEAQTLKTSGSDVGVVVKGNYSPSGHNASRIIDPIGLAPTVMENHGTVTAVETDLKIRKLTPKECFRLMGVKDEDYERIAKNQSNSSLYHLAGDSIVVNVLMAIFKELLRGD